MASFIRVRNENRQVVEIPIAKVGKSAYEIALKHGFEGTEEEWIDSLQGEPGETGTGITNIEKTSVSGLIDTYTITFTNGDTTTFTVTNGAEGVQGIQGEKGEDGHTPVITIQNGKWYIDGVDSGKSAEGVKGDTGNGISSIAKTKTEGLVDTYAIIFTNGDTTTFMVTNGAPGAQGEQGIQGVPGKDGNGIVSIEPAGGNAAETSYRITFTDGTHFDFIVNHGFDGEDGADGVTPHIGENGNWYIGDTDMGVKAAGTSGTDGKDGNGIVSIEEIASSPDDTTYLIHFSDDTTFRYNVLNGATPHIGENGNWYIGDTDTDVKAAGTDGQDGANGKGIASVAKTSTSGLVDTYTITFTDGAKTTFTITNGADGKDGTNGVDGEDGVGIKSISKTSTSGLVDTYTITLTNNTTATFTVTNGADGTDGVGVASVAQTTTSTTDGGQNVVTVTLTDGSKSTFAVKNGSKGSAGDDGYTPVRGVDYWTAEDIAAINSDNHDIIMDEMAQRNQITIPLVTSIEEMTDPTKLYIMNNDGELWYYASVTVLKPAEPLFKNVLPLAINTDGSIFEGKGYKDGWRVNSSGAYVESTVNSATGFIACNNGDFVRMRGIPYGSANNVTTPYKPDFTKYGNPLYGSAGWTRLDNGDITFTVGLGVSSGYFNVSAGTPFAEDAIITLNEEIAYSEAEEVNEWSPIQPLVYTDHTGDINTLKQTTSDHESRIAELEETVENGIAGTLTDAEKLERMIAWDKPIYDDLEAFLLDHTLSANAAMIKQWNSTTDPNNIEAKKQIQMVYDEYNTLCENHPDFVRDITDEYGGLCSDGEELMVRVYEFCEYDGRQYNAAHTQKSETKPTIIVSAGVHKEWGGLVSVTKALTEIVTNPALRYLRRNCRFIVVPLLNPYCFLGYSTAFHNLNANGVEIHKAFGDNLTEVECQYLDNIFKAYPDAALYLSCHSAQRDSTWGVGFVWPSSSTNYTCNLGYRLIDMMSAAWHEKYGETYESGFVAANEGYEALPTGDWRVGHGAISKTENSEYKQAIKYGIQGLNVEVLDTFWVFSEDWMSSYVVTHGAETYINLFRLAMRAYDIKDKTAQYE